MNVLSAGAPEREQRRGPPGLPGVLSPGGRAVAQPDGEGASGGVRRREGAEESGRCRGHRAVHGGASRTCSYLRGQGEAGSEALWETPGEVL